MKGREELKAIACAAIDTAAEELVRLGEEMMACPEAGYAERKTGEKIRARLAVYGVKDLSAVAYTGLKGWMRGRRSNAAVALIGELDAVISPQHPAADPVTGAAHACGHGAQLAVLAACAVGLGPVAPFLDGDLCFMAAPAEEYIQMEYREALKAAGHIAWFGGKQELIATGAFDGIDAAMMVHAETDAPHARVVTGGDANGFIGKRIQFQGQEAHAGAAPWDGVNALNAASLAVQAIHALRETFREEDRIRVHPILTKGGDAVNTVPADVWMECYVRAASSAAMASVNARVNRAVRGAAYALGAEADIRDYPGYYPLRQNAALSALFAENARRAAPRIALEENLPFGGSTDMGDLAWFLPAIQPTVSGFRGALHSARFAVSQPELAYLLPAKLLAMTAIDLLADGAAGAVALRKAHPQRTPADYARLWAGILAADMADQGIGAEHREKPG